MGISPHIIGLSILTVLCSQGTIEEKAVVDLVGGEAVEILVEYTNTSPPGSEGDRDLSQPALMRGVVCHIFPFLV